jgi:cytochrome c oxidase cbb3-type subunit 3
MKRFTPWWIRIPVVFFTVVGLMEYSIDSGDQPAFIAFPITLLFLGLILLVLVAIELILDAVENVLFHGLSAEAKERYLADKNKPVRIAWLHKIWIALIGKKAAGVTDEAIILDHDYDGIKELDNNLPPWWIYLFYATAIFAVVYLVRFDVFKDYTQDEEYQQEVAMAQAAIEAYKKTAKDLVDINTVTLLTEASDLSSGKNIFESNCVACHMADGGGGIGPNLTDQHWILGGGVKNVFRTISEGGRDGKGMIAWKQSLKPVEMAQVASYVISLGGTTPAQPKPAEGEIWSEEAPQE